MKTNIKQHQPVDSNFPRTSVDKVLLNIADYVDDYLIESKDAYEMARLCLLDSLGCAVLALRYPECTKLLGPIVPGTIVPNGCRVPGTNFTLDPVCGAFNIGCMIRWLDYNDTWLACEWGHPSDNLGGILATADYISRSREAVGQSPLLMQEVFTAMIKAYEIQGVIALENSFNQVGLDHVILVKVATAAVVAKLFGANKDKIVNALSNAWIDGHPLRTYRHAPNTGSRKSWAAGDATSRGVLLALLATKGEMGYYSALSAKKWGFYDVLFKGNPFKLERQFGSYVIENILFKINFPAEFHAQTAAESAIHLHSQVGGRLFEIERIEITTQESALRIIDKKGPLYNRADRDHCLQYIVAVSLIFGGLTADSYSDQLASDPRIDKLRGLMTVTEDLQYSKDYLDPAKRAIANAVQIFFKDGTKTEKLEIVYPIGHKRRRAEGVPLLKQKFINNLTTCFDSKQVETIESLLESLERLKLTPVHKFLDLFVI